MPLLESCVLKHLYFSRLNDSLRRILLPASPSSLNQHLPLSLSSACSIVPASKRDSLFRNRHARTDLPVSTLPRVFSAVLLRSQSRQLAQNREKNERVDLPSLSASGVIVLLSPSPRFFQQLISVLGHGRRMSTAPPSADVPARLAFPPRTVGAVRVCSDRRIQPRNCYSLARTGYSAAS